MILQSPAISLLEALDNIDDLMEEFNSLRDDWSAVYSEAVEISTSCNILCKLLIRKMRGQGDRVDLKEASSRDIF